EPDHKEEQHQPDLGDRLDAVLVGDELQPDPGANDHASEEVGDDQRLLDAPRDRGDQRSGADTDADAREKVARYVHLPRSASTRKRGWCTASMRLSIS